MPCIVKLLLSQNTHY